MSVWFLVAYMVVLFASQFVCYAMGSKIGYRRGVLDEKERRTRTFKDPSNRVRRTKTSDGPRIAHVRSARIIARRQPRPEPRRGKMPD